MALKLNNRGFTLIAALTIIVLMGIALGAVGKSWKTIMKREREKELIFRGNQIKEALENWYNKDYPPGKGHLVHPLNELKDLVESPFSLQKEHYLRKLYLDPITQKEWIPLKAADIMAVPGTTPATIPGVTPGVAPNTFPGMNSGMTPVMSPGMVTMQNPAGTSCSPTGIIGVRSSSEEESLKSDFTDIPNLKLLSGKKHYNEWFFACDPANKSVAEHAKTYNSYQERGN